MTKEEAIKIINCYDIGFYDLSGEKIPADKLAEAFDMATEALERTPNAFPTHECVEPTHEYDVVSRDKVLNLVLDVCYDVMDECETVTGICGEEVYTDVREVDAILKCNRRIRNGIRLLPSEPVGNSDRLKDKWNAHEVANTEEEQPIAWVCSKCGEVVGAQYNFCPNCRADMEGADDEIRSNR